MHMEWELSLSLGFLLFRCQHLEQLLVDALGEQFFHTLCRENILKSCLRLFYQPAPERTKAQLDYSPVVKNLRRHVRRVNRFLKVRHEKHVACSVEIVVQGMVIYMT